MLPCGEIRLILLSLMMKRIMIWRRRQRRERKLWCHLQFPKDLILQLLKDLMMLGGAEDEGLLGEALVEEGMPRVEAVCSPEPREDDDVVMVSDTEFCSADSCATSPCFELTLGREARVPCA